MKPQLHEFPEMVEELVQGGFSEPQSTSLVKFVSRVLSGHHEHVDAAQAENREQFAQVRGGFDSKLDAAQAENREQFAQVRGEIDSKLDAAQTENREQFAISRKETQAGFDQLKGWMIAMLSALFVAFVGAATASMIQQ